MNFSMVSKITASLLLLGVLSACGSSSSDVASAAAPVAPTTFTVSGTAATGAVFANATITIIGSDGTSYGGTGADVTAADGSYTITLPLSAKPPFVVKAARDDQTLVSVVAEAKDTTTNITPVTNLIASRLSTSGDPAKLADEIEANPALVDAAKLTAKVAEIVTLIQPLMDAVGDSTDPLNGNIQAAVNAGTGADKVLDSLSISITPSSATTVNIEVSLKQKQAEGEQPVVIAFSGGANATAPATALPAVEATDLVDNGTATLIADLLQRLTACYALAQTDRINSGGTTAADIKADACKDIFFGKDPANYKNNGTLVSSTGAFAPIFNAAAVGAKFDNGSYEFTRANGDLVIAFRSTTGTTGSSTNNILVVRADTDGKLRAIGNQYLFNGSVSAYHQLRNFVSQPAADYYSTGYNLFVNNKVDASGNPIFAKVVVTSPKGNVLMLKPNAGSAYLPLVKINSSTGAQTVTGTSFVRIRSVYVDPANSAKNPADADTNNFFAATPYTDAEIAAIPAQANWKFEYYLAGNATTTPDATQYYKTRARAMTIPELQTQPLAKVPDADVASAKADTLTATNGAKYLPTPATGPVDINWEVPTGALAPTSIQIYGPGFNDRATVASTARTGNIFCSKASNADTHCDSAGNYAASGRFNGAHLYAIDPAGREFAHFYAFYTITP